MCFKIKKTATGNITKTGIYFLLLVASFTKVNAQVTDHNTIKLSMQEAIRYAKESNKLVGVYRTEESAVQSDLQDAEMGVLPRIASNAAYQRYTRITIFDGVLGDSKQLSKPPNSNAGALNLEASFNLYSGGRHRSIVRDAMHKTELASINTKEQEATIGLQVALQYLEMVRYYFQEQLINDQVARAETRSKNIGSFYANGKVTKSDLLRAEVLLSNALLGETTNKNDYAISNQRLNTLLNLGASTQIIPVDTASLNLPDSAELENLLKDYAGAYAILKARKQIDLQENRVALAKSFNHPSIGLFGGYGVNYPNTLVFPPKAETFAVGLVGVRVSYEISSLYHNKNKVRSAKLRETGLRQQQSWITDNIQQETRTLAIKYFEAVNRLQVIRKSIEQAEINYQIQNTKYANQLSLLTDLLDADNLYQESRFNYIQANIAALSIYYRLLFITGKL
jgi:outer membrane protein TolC